MTEKTTAAAAASAAAAEPNAEGGYNGADVDVARTPPTIDSNARRVADGRATPGGLGGRMRTQ